MTAQTKSLAKVSILFQIIVITHLLVSTFMQDTLYCLKLAFSHIAIKRKSVTNTNLS